MAAAAKRKIVPLPGDPGRPKSLDCVITVEGKDTGKGGNGRPEKTLSRPVREFLRSSTFYFQAVKKHLKSCTVCDPAEALEGFMKSRDERQGGQVSRTFLDFADKFVRDFRDRLPPGFEKRIAMGCLESDFQEFRKRMNALPLSLEDVVEAMDRAVDVWKADFRGKTLPEVRRAARRPDTKIEVSQGMISIESGGGRLARSPLWPLKRLQLEVALGKLSATSEDVRMNVLVKRAEMYDEGWTRREMYDEMEEIDKLHVVHSVMSK